MSGHGLSPEGVRAEDESRVEGPADLGTFAELLLIALGFVLQPLWFIRWLAERVR